jgi:hypothetical protein
MPDGPPPHVRSLLARLRNHCRSTGLDQPRAQRHLAVMVVTQMLDGAVIKGGRNLEVRYGLRATRASTDLDVTRSVTLPTFLDELDDSLATGWQGFTGTARERGSIAAPVPQDRRPHQIDIVTHYRGASGVGTVRLEVVREELDLSAAPDIVVSRDASELFHALGLHPPAAVPVLPLPLQIAQKLHACTSPDDPSTGRINERVHDLIDLRIMVQDLGDDGLSAVRHADDVEADRTLLKVGMSDRDTMRRFRQQQRTTELPEDPELLRVYVGDLDSYAVVERQIHELLRAADHRQARGNATGTEWFLTSLKFIDAIAGTLGLRPHDFEATKG